MKLIIDNYDGFGPQDYTQTLDAGGLPNLTRRLNEATEMHAWLGSADPAFRVPASGARIVLQREDGHKLFTGYLTGAPQQEVLGRAQRGTACRYALVALDDSWLLEHNAPAARTPFAYRSVGDALRTITNDVLPGILDASGVQELGHVYQYEASSQRPWSEHAKELATAARACYRVHDGKLTLQAVGQQSVVLDEKDSKFLPKGLILAEPDRLVNDLTVVGEVEPTTYVRDYFIGDNTTLGFYLSRSPFARNPVTIVEEEYAGPALSPTMWYETDPLGKAGVSGGQLQISGGPVAVGLVEAIELAGGLRIQHGQITFTAPSNGTLGGIYSTAVSDSNCVAGFRITPNGGNCSIQAVINGVSAGNVVATQPGHQYSLVTQLFVNEAHRVHETYWSSANAAGGGRGGDTVPAAMRVVLSVHDVDPNNPGTLALPATVLYDNVLGATPAFALYALANGSDLHAQVAYTKLQRIADVEVRSMIPGQPFRTRLAGALYDGGECYVSSAGELHFYPPYPPQANEQIVVSYRASARAIARVQDSNSVASHKAGTDQGRRSKVRRMSVPPALTSVDCESAALSLLDDSVQPAWVGEYKVVSDNLPADDVWPGDSVQVEAPSRHAAFTAVVRQVDVQMTALSYDRSDYRLQFANDAAEPLAAEFAKTKLPDPLPIALTTAGPSSALYLPALTAVQVASVIATQITVDTGTMPPAGGGFEVRRSDGGWGAASDGNLVGRYATQTFVLPRLSRVQEYLVRQYDNSSPAKYSRQSALVHVDYPL